MARAITFTKAQVRRAVEATKDAGQKVRGVRVYPDGSIEVVVGEIEPVPSGQRAKGLASWEDA
jgi:hypothetical protein